MSRRYKLGLIRKGYLQIDAAFAILVFFILFLFVYNLVEDSRNSKEDMFIVNKFEADARDICRLLVLGPGMPYDWQDNISRTQFFGFKNISTNSLSLIKMQQFNSTNYFDIIDIFSLDSYLNIKVTGLTSSNVYLDWGYNANISVKSGNYICYSNCGGEMCKVSVEVWK